MSVVLCVRVQSNSSSGVRRSNETSPKILSFSCVEIQLSESSLSKAMLTGNYGCYSLSHETWQNPGKIVQVFFLKIHNSTKSYFVLILSIKYSIQTGNLIAISVKSSFFLPKWINSLREIKKNKDPSQLINKNLHCVGHLCTDQLQEAIKKSIQMSEHFPQTDLIKQIF